MHEQADFARLKRALDNAIAALPLQAAPSGDAQLRRDYLEMVLMLVQARERARDLGARLAGNGQNE
jgi:hypothetical protein